VLTGPDVSASQEWRRHAKVLMGIEGAHQGAGSAEGRLAVSRGEHLERPAGVLSN